MLKSFISAYFIFTVFLTGFPEKVYSVPFVTLETEIVMGKEADNSIISQYGLYQDKPLQIYVNQIGQKLVSKLSNLNADKVS